MYLSEEKNAKARKGDRKEWATASKNQTALLIYPRERRKRGRRERKRERRKR